MKMSGLFRNAAAAVVLLGSAGIIHADIIPARFIDSPGTGPGAINTPSDSPTNESKHELIVGVHFYNRQWRAQDERVMDVLGHTGWDDSSRARSLHSGMFRNFSDQSNSASNADQSAAGSGVLNMTPWLFNSGGIGYASSGGAGFTSTFLAPIAVNTAGEIGFELDPTQTASNGGTTASTPANTAT
jgi:hypothetical protein